MALLFGYLTLNAMKWCEVLLNVLIDDGLGGNRINDKIRIMFFSSPLNFSLEV